MSERFKIMHVDRWVGGRKPPEGRRFFVPWEMVAPHEAQAHKNHGQTLARLNERGGLSPNELVAVLEDRKWQSMDAAAAEARLNELVEAWLEQ